jgi:hypothetical protein
VSTRISIDRRVLVGGALGVAAVALVWGAVNFVGGVYSHLFGPSCVLANPDGSYSSGACPPAVIPAYAGGDGQAPVTVVSLRLASTMEGEIYFVEAASADDQLLWYQPLVSQPGSSTEAIAAVHLPRGSYDFRFYYRVCGGTCQFLSAPEAVCTVPFTLAGPVVIEWDWSRDPCASERPVAH